MAVISRKIKTKVPDKTFLTAHMETLNFRKTTWPIKQFLLAGRFCKTDNQDTQGQDKGRLDLLHLLIYCDMGVKTQSLIITELFIDNFKLIKITKIVIQKFLLKQKLWSGSLAFLLSPQTKRYVPKDTYTPHPVSSFT